MFHPLIFDNLRVVLEGAVYDRDLAGEIAVTERADVMDMASFQRVYRIAFRTADDADRPDAPAAVIELTASLADIAGEQLSQPLADVIGCTIFVRFTLPIRDVPRDSERVRALLHEVWGDRPHIVQTVSARLDEHRPGAWPPDLFQNHVTLDFHRKIGEDNIPDMNGLVEHTVRSLFRLGAIGLDR